MISYGDIPAKDLDLVKELQDLEALIGRHIKDFPSLSLAKGMTCISHDYYSIYFDEEGDRLLNRAESLCPGYFKGPIILDMAKDKEFKQLVLNLEHSLGADLLYSLGYKYD